MYLYDGYNHVCPDEGDNESFRDYNMIDRSGDCDDFDWNRWDF